VHDGGDVFVVGHVLAVPVRRLHAHRGVEVAQVPPVQHRRLHTDAENVRQIHHSQLPDTRNTQCRDDLFACSTNVRQGSITIRRSHRRRRKNAGSPSWRCGPGATRRSSGTPRGTAAPNIPWQMKITNVELITVQRHRPNTKRSGTKCYLQGAQRVGDHLHRDLRQRVRGRKDLQAVQRNPSRPHLFQ
jgi:hypothetical protein